MSEAGLNGSPVNARINYDCKAGTGEGRLVEIAAKGARVAQADLSLGAGENVALSYSFFATSTPVRMTAEVKEGAGDSFTAHFTNVDPILKNMLRLILRKLKNQPEGQPCNDALLPDG